MIDVEPEDATLFASVNVLDEGTYVTKQAKSTEDVLDSSIATLNPVVIVVVAVAVWVHERIHGEFGTGDTGLLRGLRD